MSTQTATATCSVALKEWAATCRALGEGRQIVLLRKGGILDEEGVFHLEHTAFWLQPTYLHQDEKLVKAEHRDLFERAQSERASGENKKFIALRWFATVADVFALTPDDEDRLRAAPHIWSDAYLDLRFGYNPQHPLLCVALRVWEAPAVAQLPMRPEWMGCRSWIETEALSLQGTRPALDEATFAHRLQELRRVLGRSSETHAAE